jgi:hypothetical protein
VLWDHRKTIVITERSEETVQGQRRLVIDRSLFNDIKLLYCTRHVTCA